MLQTESIANSVQKNKLWFFFPKMPSPTLHITWTFASWLSSSILCRSAALIVSSASWNVGSCLNTPDQIQTCNHLQYEQLVDHSDWIEQPPVVQQIYSSCLWQSEGAQTKPTTYCSDCGDLDQHAKYIRNEEKCPLSN